MIKLTELPTVTSMESVKFTGTVTEHETIKDVIDWILKHKEYKHGSIKISFFNHQMREPINVRYERDFLCGQIAPKVLRYSVIDIDAKQWSQSMDFEISAMDPNSTEYSGLRNEDDDDWED